MRIVDSAIVLAETGGFEAVRMRDIASHASVAVGTVYNRFKSKEDILVAVLAREVGRLEELMARNPSRGGTTLERVTRFFEVVSAGLFARPRVAQAALRATTSGEPELTEKVDRFHTRMTDLIAEAIAGDHTDNGLTTRQTEQLAFILSQLWFSGLVGWMGGLFRQDEVVTHVHEAAEVLIRGLTAAGSPD